jgi:mRNA-degrading endonuclease toxin of MazEF toxin-antitoxin module
VSLPKRGEVWLADLGFAAKVRPVLIVAVPSVKFVRRLGTLSSQDMKQVKMMIEKWLGLAE